MYCVCSIHEVPSAVDWPTVLVAVLAIVTAAVAGEPSLVLAGHSDIIVEIEPESKMGWVINCRVGVTFMGVVISAMLLFRLLLTILGLGILRLSDCATCNELPATQSECEKLLIGQYPWIITH